MATHGLCNASAMMLCNLSPPKAPQPIFLGFISSLLVSVCFALWSSLTAVAISLSTKRLKQKRQSKQMQTNMLHKKRKKRRPLNTQITAISRHRILVVREQDWKNSLMVLPVANERAFTQLPSIASQGERRKIHWRAECNILTIIIFHGAQVICKAYLKSV